jgi:2-phospho-L-lactate/phosphoenolpyruvate guanylyltransferase
MRYILIPVKHLGHAKERLAPLMSPAERARFAEAMLESTLEIATQTRHADRIAIVTLFEPAIVLARRYGIEVIIEKEQSSESLSVDYGTRELVRAGATSVLRLPIDLPLLRVEDIDLIFEHDRSLPSAVLVPSRDGIGTNALLRRPGDIFKSHFGPQSCSKHLAAAEEAGIDCQVLQLPRIALDIDEIDDVEMLLETGQATRIHDLLAEMQIPQRLHRSNSAGPSSPDRASRR